MIAWIRFFLTAALLISALICFAGAVTGVWRFGFVLNRLHAAGIGDTLGLFLLVLAMMLGSGWSMTTLKLLLLFVLLWFTSPVSSHFLSQIEYYTNPDLFEYTDREKSGGRSSAGSDTAEEKEFLSEKEDDKEAAVQDISYPGGPDRSGTGTEETEREVRE